MDAYRCHAYPCGQRYGTAGLLLPAPLIPPPGHAKPKTDLGSTVVHLPPFSPIDQGLIPTSRQYRTRKWLGPWWTVGVRDVDSEALRSVSSRQRTGRLTHHPRRRDHASLAIPWRSSLHFCGRPCRFTTVAYDVWHATYNVVTKQLNACSFDPAAAPAMASSPLARTTSGAHSMRLSSRKACLNRGSYSPAAHPRLEGPSPALLPPTKRTSSSGCADAHTNMSAGNVTSCGVVHGSVICGMGLRMNRSHGAPGRLGSDPTDATSGGR